MSIVTNDSSKVKIPLLPPRPKINENHVVLKPQASLPERPNKPSYKLQKQIKSLDLVDQYDEIVQDIRFHRKSDGVSVLHQTELKRPPKLAVHKSVSPQSPNKVLAVDKRTRIVSDNEFVVVDFCDKKEQFFKNEKPKLPPRPKLNELYIANAKSSVNMPSDVHTASATNRLKRPLPTLHSFEIITQDELPVGEDVIGDRRQIGKLNNRRVFNDAIKVVDLKRELENLPSLSLETNLNKIKSLSSPHLSNKYVSDEDDTFDVVDKSKKDKKSAFQKLQNVIQVPNMSKLEFSKRYFSFHGEDKMTNHDLRKRTLTAPSAEFSDLLTDQEVEWFDHVLVVTLRRDSTTDKLVPYISFRFPPQIDKDKESHGKGLRMQSIPQFCFPDISETQHSHGYNKSETFSFVLTDDVGGRMYGYCRLIQVEISKHPEVYCIVTPHQLFPLYSQILDEVETQRSFSPTAVFSFLKAVLTKPLPKPLESVNVSFFAMGGDGRKTVQLSRSDNSAIHEHVDLNQLFSTLPVVMIVHLLGCLLIESKVILTSASLSLLSSCCHGLTSLMYPFSWQHTYIPVLPTSLIDIVCLPTPYLLGILPSAVGQLSDLPFEEVTVVDLDKPEVLYGEESSGDILPRHITDTVSEMLEEVMLASRGSVLEGEKKRKVKNQVIAEIFVEAYIDLIGHFEDFYYTDGEGVVSISKKQFYKASRTKDQKTFLKTFVNTQAFHQFTTTRKNNGPSQGLFEMRFGDWKVNRKTGNAGFLTRFKDMSTTFKAKFKI